MKYIEVCHLGCKCKVNEDGDCFCQNSKGEWVHRDWHCNEDGYPAVTACGFRSNGSTYYRSIQVHILVAIAFIPNPNGKKEVNHLDFDRKNPAASNLEWVTHAENIAYSSSAGDMLVSTAKKTQITGIQNSERSIVPIAHTP